MKKAEKVLYDAHVAMAPVQPWLLFAAPGSSSINVVLMSGNPSPKSVRKLKTDYNKRPVTALTCHPCRPLL
eukprot:4389923-Pyramimonas_sp.AAC.1